MNLLCMREAPVPRVLAVVRSVVPLRVIRQQGTRRATKISPRTARGLPLLATSRTVPARCFRVNADTPAPCPLARARAKHTRPARLWVWDFPAQARGTLPGLALSHLRSDSLAEATSAEIFFVAAVRGFAWALGS